MLGEKLLQRKKPVWCVFWIEQTSVFGPKVQQNVYIIVKPFKIIMSCHGLLKHPDCQLQNKVKLAEKGRKMYNNVISDWIEFLTYFFSLSERQIIWLKVEGIFFENVEIFGQKWGNLPIRGKKGNIKMFATSPQILVFNTATMHQMIIQNSTDLILSHTGIK